MVPCNDLFFHLTVFGNPLLNQGSQKFDPHLLSGTAVPPAGLNSQPSPGHRVEGSDRWGHCPNHWFRRPSRDPICPPWWWTQSWRKSGAKAKKIEWKHGHMILQENPGNLMSQTHDFFECRIHGHQAVSASRKLRAQEIEQRFQAENWTKTWCEHQSSVCPREAKAYAMRKPPFRLKFWPHFCCGRSSPAL